MATGGRGEGKGGGKEREAAEIEDGRKGDGKEAKNVWRRKMEDGQSSFLDSPKFVLQRVSSVAVIP